jgi:hypothetical protein
MDFDLDCGERFVAKLALGIGSLTLGSRFCESEDAATLRRFMWTSEAEARGQLDVRGAGLFHDGSRALASAMNWNACHVLSLYPLKDMLALNAVFYGAHALTVGICKTPDLWRPSLGAESRLWVVAPGLRRFAGPMSLPEFVAAQRNSSERSPLEPLRVAFQEAVRAPPFHLPSASD